VENLRMRTIRAIDERGWHVVGIGLSVYVLVLIIFNVTDIGVVESDVLSDILVGIASVALASMSAGWWWKSSRMMGIGFLMTGFLVITRSAFLLLQSVATIGIYLGIAVGIIAIGSYVKEGHARQQERIDDSRT
jgi:hypothetical protein